MCSPWRREQGETLWKQSAPLRWERWVCSRGYQMSCSFRIHAHLQRQSPHEEPCTPACGHPLSSAPSGTRQSSSTPALAQKGGGGVGVHDSVSCANWANGNTSVAGSASFTTRELHTHANDHTMCGGWCNPCSPACTHRTASCRPFRNLGVHSTQTVCRCVLHRPHHHHDHRPSPLLVPLFLVQECECIRIQESELVRQPPGDFFEDSPTQKHLTSTARRVEQAREGRASRAMGLRRPSVVADRDTEPASGLTAAMLALKLVLWKNCKVTFLLRALFCQCGLD
jgi:hypothetical protein